MLMRVTTGIAYVAIVVVGLLATGMSGAASGGSGISVGSATVDNTGDEASVVVSAAAPSGSGIQWGDLDCDGTVGTRDSQAILRNVLEQNALSQTQPCPVIGTAVNDGLAGDLDCDGTVGTRDSQAILRKVLQQNALSQTQPCPLIGDPAPISPPVSEPISPPVSPPVSQPADTLVSFLTRPPGLAAVAVSALVLMMGATAGFMRIAGADGLWAKPEDE